MEESMKGWWRRMRRRMGGLLVLAALLGALLVTGAGAEVQLFVDKQTVRVDDPQLGEKSILNDFNPKGYRTHNYLALAWNDRESWIYDLRTHQWMPLRDFAPVAGLLTDDYALVWEPNRAAVFDARERRWIVSTMMLDQITTPLLSRGMAAVVSTREFVVYDPVLHEWQIMGNVAPKQAALGDNLAVCWNTEDAIIYDTTMHQWLEKRGISPQACIVEDYTVDTIHIYDAMKHRWGQQPR